MNRNYQLIVLCAAVLLSAGASFAGPVNINTADADTLARELNGVGEALASEIVRDRTENGRFTAPDELARVRGIGPRVVERNRDFILIDSSAEEREP